MNKQVVVDGVANQVSVINPTGMYGQVEAVTPEMAEAWLATTEEEKQRPCRTKRVEVYIAARKQDKWRLHHQGIAFDTRGVLRDGRHRLTMIVKTGLTTVLFVVRNVPDEAFLHVDEQMPRSVRDALRMAGDGDYSHSMLSTARELYGFPRDMEHDIHMDRERLLLRVRLWAEHLDFVETHAVGPYFTRGPRVLIARAHAHSRGRWDDRLQQFCAVVATGHVSDPKSDSAAVTYRNVLIAARGYASGAVEVEKYRKGQTCLKHFYAEQEMVKTRGTDEDLFPIPEYLQETWGAQEE